MIYPFVRRSFKAAFDGGGRGGRRRIGGLGADGFDFLGGHFETGVYALSGTTLSLKSVNLVAPTNAPTPHTRALARS